MRPVLLLLTTVLCHQRCRTGRSEEGVERRQLRRYVAIRPDDTYVTTPSHTERRSPAPDVVAPHDPSRSGHKQNGAPIKGASPNGRTSTTLRPPPDSPMLNYIFDSRAPSHKHTHDRYNSPAFEDAQTSAVEADTGDTAHLDCKVSALREKLVSWLRLYEHEQLELLTVGLKTHTADSRYRVEVVAQDNWRLTVADASAADSGLYCCQISTHPPMLRRSRLTVHAPEVRLARDAFLESGETLSLRCGVAHVRLAGASLHWYRGVTRLDLAPLAGGVLVNTELGENHISSELQVARLTMADAGNYTCRLELPRAAAATPAALQASATVHVLQGSSLAELQSVGSGWRAAHKMNVLYLIMTYIMR